LSHRKSGILDLNWEGTSAYEIEAYMDVLIYMGIVYLKTLEYYFYGEICVCTIVRRP
jgi:hypothetical protein